MCQYMQPFYICLYTKMNRPVIMSNRFYKPGTTFMALVNGAWGFEYSFTPYKLSAGSFREVEAHFVTFATFSNFTFYTSVVMSCK